ncbi:MAG: outer membrane protein assembly factor BamD [Bacteroidota bacterium]|nr:outer membrane protein assembly factor BamD [Bacteroidota bacterium]
MKLALVLIIPLLLFGACNNKFNKLLKSTDYQYKLKKADEYFVKKNYKNAEQLYIELFPVFKGSDKFEELYYKYAYCSFYQKNYMDAENLFKGFLGVFPNSPKAEEISYMHALTFYKQSPIVELEQINTSKAIGMMQSFINTYPNSSRITEATGIIAKCRSKLEEKEYKSAQLYYNIQQYRAAGISFNNLLITYPESNRGEEYMLKAIKSFYEFAKLSVPDKQEERYAKVSAEYFDFADRYPESKLLKDAEDYKNLSQNYIKQLQNEQIKTPANR